MIFKNHVNVTLLFHVLMLSVQVQSIEIDSFIHYSKICEEKCQVA